MFSRITHLKISAFRWVHSLKGWGWLTCVRFQDRGHPQIYAVLVRDGKILDGHYAVQTHACDTQTLCYVRCDAGGAAFKARCARAYPEKWKPVFQDHAPLRKMKAQPIQLETVTF